ncbi:MAG: hypothetical protein SF002_10330 [Alphaproteobacteria bacterium]|nr:hypothetical protein [Alphaproteobacteria bacterium]
MRVILAMAAAMTLLAACAEKPVVPETSVSTVPIYCYRTLAVVDCHPEPLGAKESSRLVNHYGPAPVTIPR